MTFSSWVCACKSGYLIGQTSVELANSGETSTLLASFILDSIFYPMRYPISLFWAKLTRYEYWPWWVFYLPIVPYFVYQAIRARSLAFFTSANPFIELSGLVNESKADIMAHLPAQYKPETLFFPGQTPWQQVRAELERRGIDWPVIIKPNIGERGKGVERIKTEAELATYLAHHAEDFIVQPYIDFPLELGVLYYRMPGSTQGRITSLTQKEFLAVVGDGQQSIRQLVGNSVRARLQLTALEARLGPQLDLVLPKGEQRLLEPIGNHSRGTKFVNANPHINPALHAVFDQIAAKVPGFHYGRFDLRVPSWEALYAGRDIRIVELNGISSEPGHIYDPNYRLVRAYRDVAEHLRIMADISLAQRKRGILPAPLGQVYAALRAWA
jgi:ATP-grasp domain